MFLWQKSAASVPLERGWVDIRFYKSSIILCNVGFSTIQFAECLWDCDLPFIRGPNLSVRGDNVSLSSLNRVKVMKWVWERCGRQELIPVVLWSSRWIHQKWKRLSLWQGIDQTSKRNQVNWNLLAQAITPATFWLSLFSILTCVLPFFLYLLYPVQCGGEWAG